MNYTLRRVAPDGDRSAILTAWQSSFSDLTEHRLEWMYVRNPAGPALAWVAMANGGEVVGAASLIPRRFSIDGQVRTGGIAADFCVAPVHRGFGPALALQRGTLQGVQAGDLAFAYGQPNRSSHALLRYVGYRTIGAMVQATAILRTGEHLSRRYGGLAGRIVGPAADIALRIRLLARSLLRRGPFVDAHPAAFDRSFDDLWLEVREKRRLLGERSAEWLTWRFDHSPVWAYAIFALRERATRRLAGYVVYHLEHGRAVIDDLLARDLDDTLDVLLRRFLRSRRRAGDVAATVSFFGEPRLVQGLERNGFSIRDSKSDAFVVWAEDSELAALLADPANWWFLAADNDV